MSKIGHFLNKSLDSEVVEKIAERCVFKNMKQNKMSNYSTVPRDIMDQERSAFLRKGKFQLMDPLFPWQLFSISFCSILQINDW